MDKTREIVIQEFEKSEDEVVVDEEPVEEEDAILLEEAPVVAQTPVAPVAEGEGEADAELAAAAVAAQPKAVMCSSDTIGSLS